jgi:AraC-like DNA-binding protein
MINYRAIRPSVANAAFVDCYWMLQGTSTPEDIQRIVPDGRPELIIHLGDSFAHRRGAIWEVQPECFFVGQISGPMLLRPTGPTNTLGIRFHPHGASRLFRIPLEELSGRSVPLHDLSPQLNRELTAVRDIYTTTMQLAHVDRVLQRGFVRKAKKDRLVEAAVAEIIASGGAVETAALADRLSVSLRQLQRRFKDEVGIGPKLLSRMQRFQRVFWAYESSSDWVDVAVECGYFDQAHLINDFRNFAGEAPASLLSPQTDLAFHFLQSSSKNLKKMSQFSKTSPPIAR